MRILHSLSLWVNRRDRSDHWELTELHKPVTGMSGGAQNFLRTLQAWESGGVLDLDACELQRLDRYADMNDGSGGFQGRFKAIRRAAWRAQWKG